MAEVKQSVLVPYSAERMFNLVDTVEEYPQFLPWCAGSELIYRRSDEMCAVLHINFRGIRQKFSTRNLRRAPHELRISLIDGPFKMLDGVWHFSELGAGGCKIDFELSWELSSGIISSLVAPVFKHIATTMVDAFIKRAQKLYG